MTTIDKTTIECYKIRHQNGSYADIAIDDSDDKGRIQIASDYGNWSYYWSAFGDNFKQFLIDLNIEYVANKFGTDRHFDLIGSIKLLKDLIINEHSHDKKIKKDLLTELRKFEVYCDGENDYINRCMNGEHIYKILDGVPDICIGISPSFKNFWENTWVIFVEKLKKEQTESVVLE